MDALTPQEIDKAHERIFPLIIKTPLISSETINKKTNANVYFKLENLQWTGSFKLRGASNKILQLSNEEKSRGIVSYSSGNHAQAVAYASNLFGVQATIIMPKNAPSIKIENTKKYGADIIFYDYKHESREKIASEIARKENKKIIKPYDDLDVIAGQGTVGKEIAEELRLKNIQPDLYLCCCGGGGLIAGSSTYLRYAFPNIKNFAVEPEKFNDTQLSLKNNFIVKNKETGESICDALLAPQPGDVTFPINQITLDGGLAVSDEEVKKTIVELAEEMKVVVEPGGAVAATALLTNKINVKNKNVVLMISGGNIDYELFSSIVRNC
ncbi:MAG: threonine/serine dehydratase [Pelagibacteraceae bacterium]|jgi:threonine dehydratase|nr:threonine/serine dehydratase [Pelagibacteraceae bacterium]HJL58267.1 threonine/serine dehydratase [Alphaproteobacteria bacterium]MBO6466882.1 threonine/serine dehydratase [Pelagibacteraceae bacterium]MBO6467305.1 threonine/serine dehydratase [Pelagibacteraceae bacterium]MBO6469202.1 threonine/serine dehydratase [Pelagibacteraceae bacterium]